VRRTGAVTATHIALVTARAALALDEDLPPLEAALKQLGAEVALACWDDPDVDWAAFDLAVLRSAWDYAERVDEFLAWTGRCAAATRLLNVPEVVRFSTDKHYLLHLAAQRVPIVPTQFVEPGQDAAARLREFLDNDAIPEFVVKPAVGAGSRDAARYRRASSARAAAHIVRLLAERRSVMLQPYLERIDAHGETAVIYIEGVASHAIRKGPLLEADADLVSGLFAPETITPRVASDEELEVADRAQRALPFSDLPYARVDLIHDADGHAVVLEVELVEPSLFFNYAPGSAERFARALMRRVKPLAADGGRR
jgi:O-ureido-D-serine cyclo-ligase